MFKKKVIGKISWKKCKIRKTQNLNGFYPVTFITSVLNGFNIINIKLSLFMPLLILDIEAKLFYWCTDCILFQSNWCIQLCIIRKKLLK
jgi:hypothetical protein